MSNMELIQSMSRERLAEFLSGDCPPGTRGLKCPEGSCTKCWERWLQEEREE